jgi:hypothetical protein
MNPYTRETIENWAGDFCSSDRIRQAHPSVREHASAILVEFLTRACSARDGGVEPGDVEEADLKAALLDHVARLNLPSDSTARRAKDPRASLARGEAPARSAKRGGADASADTPGAGAHAHVPELCALFLTALEEDGRLAGGRTLGAFIRALREPYERAVKGKGETFTRPGAKIGRNDPCPCGSGRKYKACCMRE